MKIRYLALETSSPRLSVATADADRIVATYESALQWRHAESLFDGMQQVLRRSRWKVQQLTGIAVCTGPGSFTGIRIGLAAARALGQTLRIPVVGISSLTVMAAGLRPQGSTEEWIAPSINALRGEVFTAVYRRSPRGSLHRVVAEHRVPKEKWLTQKRARVPANATLREISDENGDYPAAATLLELARPKLAKAGAAAYKRVLPFYLRDASAVERRS